MAVGMPQRKEEGLLVDGTILPNGSRSCLLGVCSELGCSQSPRDLVIEVRNQYLGSQFLLFGNGEIAAQLQHLTLDARMIPVAIRFLTHIGGFDAPIANFLGKAKAKTRKTKIPDQVIHSKAIFIDLGLAKQGDGTPISCAIHRPRWAFDNFGCFDIAKVE